MSNKILVTDSLFIFDEHIKRLEAAGFEVERLDKAEATETELCEAVKGKVGYILGGIEKVNDKVIDAADQLRVLTFTGADWKGFIPGYEKASSKSIAITNTPGANTYAVTEYTVTLLLAMLRRIFELGLTGTATFKTTESLSDVSIGILGMGRIGEAVARTLHNLGAGELYYWNRHRKPEVEQSIGIKYVELEELFDKSQILSGHVSSGVGQGFIGKDLISRLADDTLIINTGYHETFDMESLYKEVKDGRLRAAFDHPLGDFSQLPLSNWFSSNAGTAYNTTQANKRASDMAVESVINILKTGEDQYKVN